MTRLEFLVNRLRHLSGRGPFRPEIADRIGRSFF